jgi:D-aminopeptidase
MGKVVSRFLLTVLCCLALASHAQEKPAMPRARDLGVPFDGTPGPLNAITDVSGIAVGHTTLISGEGRLQIGKGPVRTGVTAILPRGKDSMSNPVFAGWWSLNGNGEMTGTTWVEESGFLEGPVMITNTHSVGVVRDAVIQWRVAHGQPDPTGYWWSLPVVAETWDGWLNDINGFHVKPEHAFHAIDSAKSGPVEEGNVGGGTGMICNEFKGGIGTSSRKIDSKAGSFTIAPQSPHRRCSRRQRNSRGSRLRLNLFPRSRSWLDHRRRRHRRSAPSSPAQAPRSPRRSRPRPRRQHFRQRLRRHLYRFLHRQLRRIRR